MTFVCWKSPGTGRVSHYGVNSNNATDTYLNASWTGYSMGSPRTADEAINLNFWFPVLDYGASVTFSFVNILQVDMLQTAMGNVSRGWGTLRWPS